jgi:ATP-dependent RNA helicase DDX3X
MFHEIIQNNIRLSQYERPTPVQKNAVPIIAAGRDLMACAQTGSGKTAAFLMPIMNSIYRTQEPIESYRMSNGVKKWMPVGLVLAPTRELALQIYDEAKKFSYRSNLRSFVVYGGADIRTQMRNLDSNGCHLLVATPGRLIDLYNKEIISFEHIKYLVLDEADRMLDMGFEPQIREIVQQKNMPGPQRRQTLLFSATFPKQIQMMAKDFLNNYIFLAVGRVGSTSINITQRIVWADESDKLSALLNALDSHPQVLTLIFVETRRSCDELEKYLQSKQFPAISIHGKKSQSEREKALQMFRSGQKQILVATAVAARGLDISNVKIVINFDVPNDIDDYVHRIGRTGRAGTCGEAISFFNDKNRPVANELLNLLRETQQQIPDFMLRMGESRNNGGGYKRSYNGGNRQHQQNGGYNQNKHEYSDYRSNYANNNNNNNSSRQPSLNGNEYSYEQQPNSYSNGRHQAPQPPTDNAALSNYLAQFILPQLPPPPPPPEY